MSTKDSRIIIDKIKTYAIGGFTADLVNDYYSDQQFLNRLNLDAFDTSPYYTKDDADAAYLASGRSKDISNHYTKDYIDSYVYNTLKSYVSGEIDGHGNAVSKIMVAGGLGTPPKSTVEQKLLSDNSNFLLFGSLQTATHSSSSASDGVNQAVIGGMDSSAPTDVVQAKSFSYSASYLSYATITVPSIGTSSTSDKTSFYWSGGYESSARVDRIARRPFEDITASVESYGSLSSARSETCQSSNGIVSLIFGGSSNTAITTSIIEKIQFMSASSASDFGAIPMSTSRSVAGSNGSEVIIAGEGIHTYKKSFSSAANAFAWGNLDAALSDSAAGSDGTSLWIAGGSNSSVTASSSLQAKSFSSNAIATTTHGSMTEVKTSLTGCTGG
jgi:hypothetical protein